MLITRRFWIANAIIMLDEIAYLAILPLLPRFSRELELSAGEAGLLYSIYPLIGLVVALPAALLVERVGTRRVLALACGVLAAASLGFALGDHAAFLWGARALQGLAGGLAVTAGLTVITRDAPPHRSGTVIGAAAGLQSLSALLGPGLSGLMATAVGARAALVVPAVLALPLLFLVLRDDDSASARPRHGPRPREALSALRSDARVGALAMFGTGLVGSAIQGLTPLRLAEVGATASGLGAAFVVSALLGFVLVPLAGALADRLGVSAVAGVWLLTTTVLVCALGLVDVGWLLVAGLIVLPASMRVGGALAYVRGTRGLLGDGLSTSFGVMVTAWSLGAALGPVVIGVVADAAGAGPAHLLVAAGGVACAWGLTRPPGTGRCRPGR